MLNLLTVVLALFIGSAEAGKPKIAYGPDLPLAVSAWQAFDGEDFGCGVDVPLANDPEGSLYFDFPIDADQQYQSSSNSLIWTGSEFMAWEDGTGKPLVMMRSTDGLMWSSDGNDIWPIPGDAPQFCSAAKTPQGVHLICCDAWPAQHHRHLFSCTGEPPWNVLEMDAPTRIADKGTNLYYEAATNMIHAVSSGRHFTLIETQRTCGERS